MGAAVSYYDHYRKFLSYKYGILDEIVFSVIEESRKIIRKGHLEIPVLDPFIIKHLHLKLDEFGMQNSHITIDNFKATKLSTFVIDDLSVRIKSLIPQQVVTVDLKAHIPVLDIRVANYDVDVTVNDLNTFGTGHAHVRVYNPKVNAVVDAQIHLFGGVELSVQDITTEIEVGSIDPIITGVLNNKLTDKFVNGFVKNIVPDVFIFFQDEISDVIRFVATSLGSYDVTWHIPYLKMSKIGIRRIRKYLEPAPIPTPMRLFPHYTKQCDVETS